VNGKRFVSATALALCCLAASIAYCANVAGESDAGAAIGAINSRQLAKVVPGITKARVRALLGAPWRTVQYNDEDEVENEIWEYRGQDSSGTYRIHIEFDQHDVVRIVGKIPDRVPGGKGTPAKS
jgi:outer membrane protein assembly factor BamE (lipoprotein component of BamABCDE complex)